MEKDKLRAVLVMHARRYPVMKPQDVIKLCYQSEFGGGHLIRDIQSSLQFIAEEMASVESGSREFIWEKRRLRESQPSRSMKHSFDLLSKRKVHWTLF